MFSVLNHTEACASPLGHVVSIPSSYQRRVTFHYLPTSGTAPGDVGTSPRWTGTSSSSTTTSLGSSSTVLRLPLILEPPSTPLSRALLKLRNSLEQLSKLSFSAWSPAIPIEMVNQHLGRHNTIMHNQEVADHSQHLLTTRIRWSGGAGR